MLCTDLITKAWKCNFGDEFGDHFGDEFRHDLQMHIRNAKFGDHVRNCTSEIILDMNLEINSGMISEFITETALPSIHKKTVANLH